MAVLVRKDKKKLGAARLYGKRMDTDLIIHMRTCKRGLNLVAHMYD